MLKFTSDLYSFQIKSRQIQTLIEQEFSSTIYENIVELLQLGEQPNSFDLIEERAKLFFKNMVSFDATAPSLGQIYHHLSMSFNDLPYEKFKGTIFKKSLNARDFLCIPVNLGHSVLPKGKKVIHPYPEELEVFSTLNDWKSVWLSGNISTRKNAFLAPPLPMKCFGGKNLKLEQYQDWPVNSSHPYYKTHKKLFTGNAGVIVRNEFNDIVGFMKWHWWNELHVKGSDFHFCIQNRNEFIDVGFDLRPFEEKPSLGPDIEYKDNIQSSIIDENSFTVRQIKSFRFRYKLVNGIWVDE
ncbi:hypothetical protein [Marinicella marina]|uniref:hypothetical protein n=1 Tax=Marinicella marina TaxID=2996016 RepID=UPI0024BC566E|nr:hypothetical protein [Marinicella marina]MDJ1138795.1 hypothetical protein [Marinicella marina]